jgi:hypothetical protein
MRSALLLILSVLLLDSCIEKNFLFVSAGETKENIRTDAAETEEIKEILERQKRDWNRGDIEAFMIGYWDSDSLMFVGKSGVTYGYKNTLANYKKNYPDANAMGQLTFTYIEFKKLSAEHYQVTGKYHLTRTIGDASGHYTLLIKKLNGRWVIVYDHSS